MRRRRSAPPDSLELLLDTLCNTFGGVLFISMLVVMLLQLSGKRSGDQPGDKVAGSEAIEQRRATLESLRNEIDALRETNDKQEVAIELGLARAIRDRRVESEKTSRRHADLSRRRDRGLLDLGGREVHVRRIDEELAELADSLEKARKTKTAAEDDLARERKSRTRTVQAPSVRDTRRNPIALEIRYGRLYVLHTFGTGNQRIGPNLDEYVILRETSEGLEVRPNPTAGLPIGEGDAFKQALAPRLARFPSRSCYFDLIARTDSFDIFGDLRSVLGELGYEVAILPAALDEDVIDRGGDARGVQ